MLRFAVRRVFKGDVVPVVSTTGTGTVPNFDYSDANKNSGIVWNEEDVRGIHQKSCG
jgi:cytochrome c2